MTGVEEAAGKFVADLARWLWRWRRPDTSGTALIGYTDNLADAVKSRKTGLLDQLRAGPDMVIDDLEFRAESRSKLSAQMPRRRRAGPGFRDNRTGLDDCGIGQPGERFSSAL
jgi:hypothetical protein